MTTTEATAPANANGNPPEALPLPVDSFKEAASFLRRPFTVDAVKFKPQSVTKSGKTLVVAYIDARLAIERLNLVCPHLWQSRFEPLGGGLMWCHLTVDSITRSDVGQGQGKALVSDALKRAAVPFGVGVSLYAIPQTYLDGRIEYLSAQHVRFLRERYSAWLDAHGRHAFGEPLDHGDAVGGSIGDPDEHGAADAPAADPDTSGVLAGSAEVTALKAAAKGLTVAKIRMAFAAIGLPAPDGAMRFDGVPQSRVLDLGKALEGIER